VALLPLALEVSTSQQRCDAGLQKIYAPPAHARLGPATFPVPAARRCRCIKQEKIFATVLVMMSSRANQSLRISRGKPLTASMQRV
jgi:hypothetical protein